MQPSFIVSFLALATSSFAAPSVQVARGISARNVNMLYCTDVKFTGTCANFDFVSGNCYNFQGAFKDSLSSASTNDGAICVLYEHENCNGMSLPVRKRIEYLSDYRFDNIASSVYCYV